jgi:small-conductance mechanosensitive channel
MKKIFLLVFLFFIQPTSFPQTDSAKNIKTDSTLVAKVDSFSTAVDSSLTKAAKDTSKDNSIDLKPPSIIDIISFGKIIWAIIFVIIGFYIIRFIIKVLDLFAERSISYRITLKGIVPIIRITGWIIIIYILLAGIFKPPFSTVIAVTASIGIAIGFAAQDILKNIFGGIMILFDRPFQVGDKIQVGDYYGEVIKIGLRSTRVVTPDDSTVTIPNGEIMNKSVSNSNFGEPNCQVVAEIYLPINVDTNKVREIATEAAQVSKYVFLNKPITVLFFNEVKEEKVYLKMRLKAYVMDIRFEFDFKSDMTEIVMRELLSQKIISPDDFN